MRVLVTGANGFVGTHLSRMLLEHGCSVRGAVRSLKGLERLDSSVEGHVVGAIDAKTNWGKVLEGVDVVVHLAARVHVLHDMASDPLEAYREVNVCGTQRLLEASVEAGVRRFVFMSSVKAVGESTPNGHVYTESDACNPEDDYGRSKAEAEQIVLEFATNGEIEGVILRPPMVYGPGVKANFLRLMQVVKAGVPLPLKNVNNKRSMVYVNNLADAVRVCIEHPDASGQVFFVADDESLATSELVRELAQAMNKPARLIPFPVPIMRGMARLIGKTGEIDRLTSSLVVGTKKIRTQLGWSPPWSVSEGIRDTVTWFQQTPEESKNRG